jgi:predicted XRE-type DNA-binding protein
MAGKLKVTRGSDNVFRDLGFSADEARNLLMRSQLMVSIGEFVKRSGLTQTAVAKQLKLTQPRLNALLRGKIDQFSLDALVNAATLAGLRVEMKIAHERPRSASTRAARNIVAGQPRLR